MTGTIEGPCSMYSSVDCSYCQKECALVTPELKARWEQIFKDNKKRTTRRV